MAAFVEKELEGWGRYPRSVCKVHRAEKIAHAVDFVRSPGPRTRLARGLGRSYGDAALNASNDVLLTERLDRFLSFDEENGLLVCEAGVSLLEIIHVCLPHGWFLPVTPGTKFAGVGGAVACDVHGKNHHKDGSLSQHVEWLELLLADGSRVRCSPSENSRLFWATAGGLGMTGIILEVGLRLRKVDSAFLKVDYCRSADLQQTMQLLEEEDAAYTYSVAWVDCMAGGRSLGRSVLMRANHCRATDLSPQLQKDPLSVRERSLLSVPFDLPGFFLNRFSIRGLNAVYYRSFKRGRSSRLEHYNPFFYPLDIVRSWNRAYGKRGFLQYQCVFPADSSEVGLEETLSKISASGNGSFLAVLKRFGPETGLISFPRAGYTLALDFPMRGEPMLAFLSELDEIVLRLGGRVYLAKDARLTAASFRRMYPRFPEWLAVKRQVDPGNRFASDLSRRLNLHGESE